MVLAEGPIRAFGGGPIPGSDFLQLRPEAAPAKGLTAWLVDGLRGAIVDGRLAPGARLPATRVLARELGVSRGVIVDAYQRLLDEGLVERAYRGGHRGHPPGACAAARRRTDRRRRRGRAAAAAAHAARYRPRPVARRAGPVRLSARPPGCGPNARCSAGRRRRPRLRRPGRAPRLRRELVAWLARTRGVQAEADDVIVVGGVAQALGPARPDVRAAGTTAVAVEDPGSRGARDQLASLGPARGRRAGRRRGGTRRRPGRNRLRTVVLTPAHQFPTGVVLSPARRLALLDWASRRRSRGWSSRTTTTPSTATTGRRSPPCRPRRRTTSRTPEAPRSHWPRACGWAG